MNAPRIVIAGGTGLLGRMLAEHFHEAGCDVSAFVRYPAPSPWRTAHWNGRDLDEWADELEGADVLINMAGRSVNCRYNARNRQQILDSRIESTRVLAQAVAQCTHPPKLWMNASTATIYRHSLDRDMDEETGEVGDAQWSFSIRVAKAWEEACFGPDLPGTRRIALRAAMVMSPGSGGAFETLSNLVRLGLGGRAASGEQYISWIHDLDFIRAIEFLMEHADIEGCVNVCAPDPLPNRDFMRELREAWGVEIGIPASRWMLEVGAFFLRTETELILKSRRVLPQRLVDAGFEFVYPSWPEAVIDLVSRYRGIPPPE